ncbi:N-acetyltransferase family protein [Nocardia asteroides]
MIDVRPIEPRDADGFVAAFESVAAEGRWIGTELPVDDERRARWRESAQGATAGAHTLVAVDGELVVGFARVEIRHGHAHFAMALVSQYRGRGLGRRLLAACVDWARERDAHKIDLEVWPHNGAARRLYEAAGFVVEGRRRRHWRRGNGELRDSIEMSLVLDEHSPGSPYPDDPDGSRARFPSGEARGSGIT